MAAVLFLPKTPNTITVMKQTVSISAPDINVASKSSAIQLWLNSEKKSSKVCGLKNNPHLCSALHLRKARRLANNFAAGIFCVHGLSYSSVPCGALMRPLPFSRCSATGSGTFSFPYINILFHFKALQK
jgi:hypothetical protein